MSRETVGGYLAGDTPPTNALTPPPTSVSRRAASTDTDTDTEAWRTVSFSDAPEFDKPLPYCAVCTTPSRTSDTPNASD